MKLIGNFFTILLFIVLGQMCNDNESEKDQAEDPAVMQQAKKIKGEDATTDWKQFVESADQLIALSESNLKTLKFKIKSATNPNNKIKWKMVYNTSEFKVKNLKQRWERRKGEVMSELKMSKNAPVKADSLFTANFINEMTEVNREMEKVIDE